VELFSYSTYEFNWALNLTGVGATGHKENNELAVCIVWRQCDIKKRMAMQDRISAGVTVKFCPNRTSGIMLFICTIYEQDTSCNLY
jgi:hypothetical protein